MIRLRDPRRQAQEAIVPMINVAFLLLIFFLMAAVLSPPDPVEVKLPTAEGGDLQTRDFLLVLSADGSLENSAGEVFHPSRLDGLTVRLLADRSLPARLLANTILQLEASGAAGITLTTTRP